MLILAAPSIKPSVEASIVAEEVIVTCPITVLTFETTASTLAAKAAVLNVPLLTSNVPLIMTVGSSASVPINDST